MSKNKFKNAFDNALGRSQVIMANETITEPNTNDVEELKLTNVQTYIRTNVQDDVIITDSTSEPNEEILETPKSKPRINNDTKPKDLADSNKKISLKNQGWLPITILLPPEVKKKLKLKSINEKRDMSEILAEAFDGIKEM